LTLPKSICIINIRELIFGCVKDNFYVPVSGKLTDFCWIQIPICFKFNYYNISIKPTLPRLSVAETACPDQTSGRGSLKVVCGDTLITRSMNWIAQAIKLLGKSCYSLNYKCYRRTALSITGIRVRACKYWFCVSL
jgi:hypothetical protein